MGRISCPQPIFNGMKLSHLFTKTRKEAPKDEVAKNAELLVRAGFVHKEMAGVYSYLPLGLRVLCKIENIVREEMNKVGGQEIRMATLHPSEPWRQTGAWDSVDVLFKIQSRTEKEYALGQSEEEIVTPIAQEFVQSYKDLPRQSQLFTKTRREAPSDEVVKNAQLLVRAGYIHKEMAG